MEEHRDDAEAAEDLVRENEVITPDAPEADALEQAAELSPGDNEEAAVVGDAPEADALEQHRPVAGDEDDEDRR